LAGVQQQIECEMRDREEAAAKHTKALATAKLQAQVHK
jgi:hypothetical protein